MDRSNFFRRNAPHYFILVQMYIPSPPKTLAAGDLRLPVHDKNSFIFPVTRVIKCIEKTFLLIPILFFCGKSVTVNAAVFRRIEGYALRPLKIRAVFHPKLLIPPDRFSLLSAVRKPGAEYVLPDHQSCPGKYGPLNEHVFSVSVLPAGYLRRRMPGKNKSKQVYFRHTRNTPELIPGCG